MLQQIADMSKANVASRLRVIVILALAVMVLCGLALGYGYFLGRYEQIVLNKSVLKAIPEVNCGAHPPL